jgi:hypothetical protein
MAFATLSPAYKSVSIISYSEFKKKREKKKTTKNKQTKHAQTNKRN